MRAIRDSSRATIAFLNGDRPDRPGAGDPYGDIAIAPIQARKRHGALSDSPKSRRGGASPPAVNEIGVAGVAGREAVAEDLFAARRRRRLLGAC
jgi:hypothetical protein